MIRKSSIVRTIGLLILTLGVTPPARAALPQAWKNVQELRLEQAGLVKIDLPLATIDAARPALEDLRLVGADGTEIPYLLERPVPARPGRWPAKDVRVVVEGEATVVEIPVAEGQTVKALELETPAEDFIKAVRVEVLAGDGDWQPVAQGVPIYRLPRRASQLMINLPPGLWTRVRLTLDDRRSPPIPVSGARMYAAEATPVPAMELPVTIQERIENYQETRLTLQMAGSHVTLTRLTVETLEPLFTRSVSLSYQKYAENAVRESVLATGTIFRVALEGVPPVANLSLTGELPVPARELFLTIHNGDNPPLHITQITAQRRPVYLTFLAPQAGSYYLLTGNNQCLAPKYDLQAQRERLQYAALVAIQAGGLAANPDYQVTDPSPEVQAGGALDVSQWKYRKRLKISQTGVQQLDLDLEVLSRAAPGLHDLRLLAADKQLPYLLERSSLSRGIVPELFQVDDPKRPKTSRWSLRLPLPRLPVSRLTVATDTPYFKREVRLIEELTDDRGVVRQRLLQSSRWVKTPQQKEARLELSIPQQVSQDSLLLEIDNGDNPPLILRDLQVWYAVTRMLFKVAEPGGDVHLYYGNPRALPAQYDLDVVAPQMLAAAKSMASAEGEEGLQKSSWRGKDLMGGSAGVIFWAALVLVVALLLYLIARLLPRGAKTDNES
jgi:hypothetical protein